MSVITTNDFPPADVWTDEAQAESVLTIDYPSEPELVARAKTYNPPAAPQQVMYQRCGGGRRVIRKRIGD